MTNTPARQWKPTILMGLVSEELERAGTPLTVKEVIARVAAHKPRITREAVACLIEEGYLTIRPRTRYARRVLQRVEFVKPYRPPPADVEKRDAMLRRLDRDMAAFDRRARAGARMAGPGVEDCGHDTSRGDTEDDR